MKTLLFFILVSNLSSLFAYEVWRGKAERTFQGQTCSADMELTRDGRMTHIRYYNFPEESWQGPIAIMAEGDKDDSQTFIVRYYRYPEKTITVGRGMEDCVMWEQVPEGGSPKPHSGGAAFGGKDCTSVVFMDDGVTAISHINIEGDSMRINGELTYYGGETTQISWHEELTRLPGLPVPNPN